MEHAQFSKFNTLLLVALSSYTVYTFVPKKDKNLESAKDKIEAAIRGIDSTNMELQKARTIVHRLDSLTTAFDGDIKSFKDKRKQLNDDFEHDLKNHTHNLSKLETAIKSLNEQTNQLNQKYKVKLSEFPSPPKIIK